MISNLKKNKLVCIVLAVVSVLVISGVIVGNILLKQTNDSSKQSDIKVEVGKDKEDTQEKGEDYTSDGIADMNAQEGSDSVNSVQTNKKEKTEGMSDYTGLKASNQGEGSTVDEEHFGNESDAPGKMPDKSNDNQGSDTEDSNNQDNNSQDSNNQDNNNQDNNSQESIPEYGIPY